MREKKNSVGLEVGNAWMGQTRGHLFADQLYDAATLGTAHRMRFLPIRRVGGRLQWWLFFYGLDMEQFLDVLQPMPSSGRQEAIVPRTKGVHAG